MSIGRILVVEDDESLRVVTNTLLQRSGYDTAVAVDVAQALDVLHREPHDLVISDLNLPDASGMELLKKIRAEYPETAVVIITAYGTIETAVEAIRCGAYDYITKPVHPDELRALVHRALERHRLIEEVRVLRSTVSQKYGFEKIIGASPRLLRVLDMAASVANTNATILIRGETGTGKELLAKAIHFNSARRNQPFVVISCGSIPRELLESELFGHIKGSFTGAYTHKKGKVEIADGGTVFLDEIGEMPIELQVRVLRLVQEHEIEKIGATSSQIVDVRIIAATHRNLEERVSQGHFREDLYYRLSVVPIVLPPLRERPEDILLLLGEFLERAKRKHGKSDVYIPQNLMQHLVNYRWPGNIREMENLVERMVLLCPAGEVTFADLPESMRETQAPENPPAPTGAGLGNRGLEAVERELILQALRQFDWNQTKAARHLQISRKTLIYRIAKYGIEREDSNRQNAVRKLQAQDPGGGSDS